MKRTFSFWRPAVFALVFSAVAACSGPRDHAQILMPRLSVPWSESVRILGDSVPGKTFYSDFLMIRDKMTPTSIAASCTFSSEGNLLKKVLAADLIP